MYKTSLQIIWKLESMRDNGESRQRAQRMRAFCRGTGRRVPSL